MKRILITGKDSYIGTSFEKWVSQWPEEYDVMTVGTLNNEWEGIDLNIFDTVLHVAAIVHRKENDRIKSLYTEVNVNLPVKLAQKAKKSGVKQFVFMSSMSVYGLTEGLISDNTQLNPKTLYGKSKLEAEKKLLKLQTKDFKLVILRPPMVYGKNCTGNYSKLKKLSRLIYFFPNIKNVRSMIYIDNLCELIRLIIKKSQSGIFYPQNKEYVETAYLVKLIREYHGHRTITTDIFNIVIRKIIKKSSLFKKIFGNLVYSKNLSQSNDYCLFDFEESIKICESGNNESNGSNV